MNDNFENVPLFPPKYISQMDIKSYKGAGYKLNRCIVLS